MQLRIKFVIMSLKNTCISTQGGTIMPLVSMKEMLIDAKENGYAVGQYNLNNLEFTQAILEAFTRRKCTSYFRCI